MEDNIVKSQTLKLSVCVIYLLCITRPEVTKGVPQEKGEDAHMKMSAVALEQSVQPLT